MNNGAKTANDGGSGELSLDSEQALAAMCTSHLVSKSEPERRPCEQYVCTRVQALFSAMDVV